MNNIQVIERSRGQLTELRDNVMFDKLKHAFDLVPENDAERYSLIKLADDLVTAQEHGLIATQDRFAGVAKQANDIVSRFTTQSTEENDLGELVSKLASDAVLSEAAAVAFEAEADQE